MGWSAFGDLWRRAGWGFRLGLCGIGLGVAAMVVVGVLLAGGNPGLAAVLWIIGVGLIIVANYVRVRAIKRARPDWYP